MVSNQGQALLVVWIESGMEFTVLIFFDDAKCNVDTAWPSTNIVNSKKKMFCKALRSANVTGSTARELPLILW